MEVSYHKEELRLISTSTYLAQERDRTGQIVEFDWLINLSCSVPFLSARKLNQIQLSGRNGTGYIKVTKE